MIFDIFFGGRKWNFCFAYGGPCAEPFNFSFLFKKEKLQKKVNQKVGGKSAQPPSPLLSGLSTPLSGRESDCT